MSPSYREPKSQDKMPRSVWSTTGIFIALGVLTALMGLLVYGAIQGVSGGVGAPDRSTEIRARR